MFLTDRTLRRLRLGGQVVELTPAPARRLTGGSSEVAVVEALRFLRPGGADSAVVERLRSLLSDQERTRLRRRRSGEPVWLAAALKQVTAER